MDWKQIIGHAAQKLCERRGAQPLTGETRIPGPRTDVIGAVHRDETIIVEGLHALLMEGHALAVATGDAAFYANAAGQIADGLTFVSNWCQSLQTGLARTPPDHAIRARLEPMRKLDRIAAEIATDLKARANVDDAAVYLRTMGTLREVQPPVQPRPAIAQEQLPPPKPVVLEDQAPGSGLQAPGSEVQPPAPTPSVASSAEQSAVAALAQSAAAPQAQPVTPPADDIVVLDPATSNAASGSDAAGT